AVRRLPLELDGRALVLVLEELERNRIRPPAEQEDTLLLLPRLRTRAHPRDDEQLLVVIQPKTHPILRLHDELVSPRLLRDDRPVPAHAELLRIHLSRLRAVAAEGKIHPRIDA